MSPLAKRALDYALAGDISNARAMADALTCAVAAAYPTPDADGYLAAFWPLVESAWDEVCHFQPFFILWLEIKRHT
jgi:hypothetical protein